MFKKALMIIGGVAVLAFIHSYMPEVWSGVFGMIGSLLDQLMPAGGAQPPAVTR